MIGLDTNVLVRYLQEDDPAQTAKANMLISSLNSERRGYVSLLTLAEVVWILSRKFRLDRKTLVQIIDSLLRAQELIIEQTDVARKALYLFEDSKAGFSDCLIAQLGHAAGCDYTVTFDQAAGKTAGMKLL
jgi:predicted nucleic-acid-binding protein